MSILVRSIGVSIPETKVTNDELAAKVDTTDEWIRSHTGIGARHIAASGDETSDLAARAALSALEKARLGPRDIDLIVVATATPDYFGFPATACVVQDKIGAQGCAALDVTAGCTGFIYALDVASSMLEARKGRHALVIGADTLTRITDWSDRSTCVLFGDGAGAAVISRIEEGGRGIVSSILGAEGGGAKALYLEQGGEEGRLREAGPPRARHQDGRKGSLQLRGQVHLGAGRSGFSTPRCTASRTSRGSCRTRPTRASCRPRPSASASPSLAST